MRGTVLCGVSDAEDGRRALELAVEVSERLGLRLVLAHVRDDIGAGDLRGGDESVTMRADREGAARVLARLAAEYGIEDADRRSGAGDQAALIGRIAAEEGADVIVVGAKPRGRLRRGLESRLAQELESETPVPVLIAPPRRSERQNGRMSEGRR